MAPAEDLLARNEDEEWAFRSFHSRVWRREGVFELKSVSYKSQSAG